MWVFFGFGNSYLCFVCGRQYFAERLRDVVFIIQYGHIFERFIVARQFEPNAEQMEKLKDFMLQLFLADVQMEEAKQREHLDKSVKEKIAA